MAAEVLGFVGRKNPPQVVPLGSNPRRTDLPRRAIGCDVDTIDKSIRAPQTSHAFLGFLAADRNRRSSHDAAIRQEIPNLPATQIDWINKSSRQRRLAQHFESVVQILQSFE